MSRNKILLLIILLSSVFAFAIGLVLMLHEPTEEESIAPIGEVSIDNNYTSAPGEVDTELPLFVFNSKTEFAEECYGLESYGKRIIDEQIGRYLGKYVIVPKDTVLYGDYVTGSYKDSTSTPSFKVDVTLFDGETIRLTCVYNNSLQAYAIDSSLGK